MIQKKSQQKVSFNGTRTSFAQKVYGIVSKIPKGRVMTYMEVAKRAGHPRASRAVGTIMSKNRDKNVPCHRVIRSDGGMGGYAFGGVSKKQAILKKEGAVI